MSVRRKSRARKIDMPNKRRTNNGNGENGGGVATAEAAPETSGTSGRDGREDVFNLSELKDMSISALTQVAKTMDVPGATGMRKQELIFKVLAAQTEKSGLIFSEGVDRKSTRLNSSHRTISYAVFCLKKKTARNDQPQYA